MKISMSHRVLRRAKDGGGKVLWKGPLGYSNGLNNRSTHFPGTSCPIDNSLNKTKKRKDNV